MANKHIISLIESTPLAGLGEADLTAIRAHTADCEDCRDAFKAAQVSTLLLKEYVAESFELSPFFNTRVLATLRERQAKGSWTNAWALGRMWRAAGALASSMVATVAVLAVLTFVIPGNQVSSGVQALNSLPNNYSAEDVMLYQNELADEQAPDQSSDGQVLTNLYSGEDETVK